MRQKPTPEVIDNRPGLPDIKRRVGRHSTIKTSLLQSLSDRHRPGLKSLTTRDPEDWTIALLDAFSQMADTLTFYQERISNESYLGTAKESFSVQQLAALVDYQPAPPSAAQVYLAFTVDNKLPLNGVLEIPKSIPVKSLPIEEDLPQTFETLTPTRVKAVWNAIQPARTYTQNLSRRSRSFYITSGSPRPRRGDPIVFFSDDSVSDHNQAHNTYLCYAANVIPARPEGQWRVDVTTNTSGAVKTVPLVLPAGPNPSTLTAGSVEDCLEQLRHHSWERHDIQTAQDHFGLSTEDVQAALAWEQPNVAPSGLRPHRLTLRARLFGHNALSAPYVINGSGDPVLAYSSPTNVTNANNVLSPDDKPGNTAHCYLFLDRKYEDLVQGDILVFRGHAPDSRNRQRGTHLQRLIEKWKPILAVETVSVTGFGNSGEVTRVTIDKGGLNLGNVKLRSVEVFTGSESLDLALLPITDPVGAGSRVETGDIQLLCEGALLDLVVGQDVALSGLRNDAPGVASAQILRISQITLHGTHTALNFESAFSYPYVRGETIINANIALASHGESVREAIGSGDGTKPHQSFLLRSAPLTYLPANTVTGRAPALEIRVNDMRWQQVESLAEAGPADRVYTVTSIGMEPSKITFGNGTEGARLPTGENNITALYRVGGGIGGRVKAGLITLLTQKPLGIRAVTNPLPAFGGSQAENREQARKNVPVKSLTLGRIVSLNDYQNFARSFTGIAKAHASWGWKQENRIACVTVAAEDGQPLPESDGVLPLLRQNIHAVSAPGGSAIIKNFQPIWTALSAKVFIDPNAVSADGTTDSLFETLRSRLSAEFSFSKQELGAPIRLSHAAAIMQSVDGVIAVDIDYLHRLDAPARRQEIVRAYLPLMGARGRPRGVELLMMAPENIQLGVAR
ncbi:hypothetical protein N9W89_07675 [Hellea sp.]|nr:hypothetical protein [Hellea sp.]